jgi:hypothetical protein
MALAFFAAVVGCNTEPRGPAQTPDARADASAPPPASSAPGDATATCATDGDCRTFSSYCAEAPCGCRAIAKSAPDPRCATGTVSCFVDPCASKAAACQGGHCELVMGTPK